MGCWGMGMAQTDEFCEIYDKFMDSYNEGKEVAEITAAILAEYHAEFDDYDGVMHDVYFALAKAEWMCCEQSELVLNRVKEIIESGANVEFYRELEATEKDLKVRQRNLEKFWDSLQTPRAKPRQRRIDPLDRVKDLPPMVVGECYQYKFEDGYRVFAVLGFHKSSGWQEVVYCAIFEKTYSAAELKKVDFLQESVNTVAYYIGLEFIAPSSIKKIADIPVPQNLYSRYLGADRVSPGYKKGFKEPFDNPERYTLSELFALKEDPIPTELLDLMVGGCYSIPWRNGYRVAIVLESIKFWPTDSESLLICIMKNNYYDFDHDWLNEDIGHLGAYSANDMPTTREWKKIAYIPLPMNIYAQFFGVRKVIVSKAADFIMDYSSVSSMTLKKLFEVKNMI